MPGDVPQTPTTPTTPIAGQRSPQELGRIQRVANAQLRQLLRQQTDDLQDKANQPFRRIYQKTIGKGSLIHFQYLNWKHDPYPLVLVSAVYKHQPRPGLVAGVNLHYLTFRFIKTLIKQYCGKLFSYQLIKGNLYIKNSYRTYKPKSMQLVKMLDCDYLLTILGAVKSYKPEEVEAIRKFVQEQLRRMTNPKAADISREFQQMILNDPHANWKYKDYNIGPTWGKEGARGYPYDKATRTHGSYNPGTRAGGEITGL